MTPWKVQFLSGIAANFLRQVLIGKEHVQKVPQWYGETVGFWDGTTLVTWTANVQAWTLSHSMFEFSDKMETVETFKPVLRRERQVHRDSITRRYFTIPKRSSSRCAPPIVMPARRDAGQSDPAIHLHRVFEQSPEHQWQADSAHQGRPSIHRLLRPAVGAELGKVFRSRLGQAAGYSAPGHTRSFQVKKERTLMKKQLIKAG